MLSKVSVVDAYKSLSGYNFIVVSDKIHGVILNDELYCSCMGFSVHKKCKHVNKVFEYILENDLDLGEEEYMVSNIKSSIDYINDFFGGLPVGALLGQFGKHRVGKTITGIQYAFDVINYYSLNGETANALILDTEGTLATYGLKDWINSLNKVFQQNVGLEVWRFDYLGWQKNKTINLEKHWQKETILKGDNKFILIDLPNLEKAHLLFGVPVHFELSDSGKMTVKYTKEWQQYNDNFELVPIQKIVKENNIKYILFDSFSALFEAPFIGGQQNYPARHDSSVALLTQAQKIARENLISFVVNLHPTQNPADVNTQAKHLGGKSVGHNFKLMIYHREGIKGRTPNATFRSVSLERHPSKKGLTGKYMITNNGVEKFK